MRNAVTYSALLGRPVHVHNVRANRKPPGMKGLFSGIIAMLPVTDHLIQPSI